MFNKWNIIQLIEDQRQDEDISPILKAKSTRQCGQACHEISRGSTGLKDYWAQWDFQVVEDGLLKLVWEISEGKQNRKQIVVSKKKVSELLRKYNGSSSGSHLGVKKKLFRIRERFYCTRCHAFVESYCRRCEECAEDALSRTGEAISGWSPIPTNCCRRFFRKKLEIDTMDYFTMWSGARLKQEATTVTEVLVDNMFCRFSVPRKLHSDQGRNFESSIFRKMCRVNSITKTRTRSLHFQ